MHGTMPAKARIAQPVSRARLCQNTLLARLERNGRGRVARSAHPNDPIAGTAGVHYFDKIDSAERKEKRKTWPDAVQTLLRGGVRDFQ
jgi:hypothetical protein